MTIGDPWPPMVQQRERAIDLGIPEDAYQRSFAARELEQAHGRLRAPSRTTPAHFIHCGAVAPLSWTTANTEVVTAEPGRPRTVARVSAATVAELVKALGGAEEAADKVRCSAKTLRRYGSGERGADPDVLMRLRWWAGTWSRSSVP